MNIHQALWKVDAGQAGALSECICTYRNQIFSAERDFTQVIAGEECAVRNRFQICFEVCPLQIGICKCVYADDFKIFREVYALQVDAIVKRIALDFPDAIRQSNRDQ